MKTLLLALFLLAGCAQDPHEYTISPDSAKWAEDVELKAALEKLTPEEKEALAGYMIRKSVGGALGGEGIPPMGVSIKDAIADQQAWEAERKREEAEAAALAERIRVEKEARLKTLRDAVTVAVAEMYLRPSNYRAGRYSDSIALTVAFENHADKDVVGVKGMVKFSDLFGDEIKSISLSYDEGIKANATASWAAELRYNQFIAEDVKLGNTPLDKMKVTWEPETIIYADGTTLSANE
jgi:hypothetical protein